MTPLVRHATYETRIRTKPSGPTARAGHRNLRTNDAGERQQVGCSGGGGVQGRKRAIHRRYEGGPMKLEAGVVPMLNGGGGELVGKWRSGTAL